MINDTFPSFPLSNSVSTPIPLAASPLAPSPTMDLEPEGDSYSHVIELSHLTVADPELVDYWDGRFHSPTARESQQHDGGTDHGAITAPTSPTYRSVRPRGKTEALRKSAHENENLALNFSAFANNFDKEVIGLAIPVAFNAASLATGVAALGLRVHHTVRDFDSVRREARKNILGGIAEIGGIVGSSVALVGKALGSTATTGPVSAGFVAGAAWAEAAASTTRIEGVARGAVAMAHTGAAISVAIGEPFAATILYSAVLLGMNTLGPLGREIHKAYHTPETVLPPTPLPSTNSIEPAGHAA